MEDEIVYQKIKEGDTVKVVKNTCGHDYEIGDIYEVKRISRLDGLYGNHRLVLDEEVIGFYINVSNVELIKNK
jgi:hypothetical protein